LRELGCGTAVLCRVGARVCAVPTESVSETMRPLPIEPLAGMPAFVLGVSVIRGVPTPVIDAGRMLGAKDPCQHARFVRLRIGSRAAALAVDSVIGVVAIDAMSLNELPPLLRDADTEVIDAIGIQDVELLLVLRAARVAPPSVWSTLDERKTSR
jgi:purine-binding chemotaxis protein CheW